MTGARLTAALECANDAGGRCALWPSGDAHACYGVSHDTATSCAFAAGSVSAARAALTGTGATPQSKGLVRVRGPGVFAHLPPPSWGRSRAIDPSRKGVGPMRPAALAIIGTALGAAAGHAFRAPFPGMGGNPVLDLIAYHDPGLHTVIRVWYYAVPAVVVVLAGSVCLSVWRVWLQPRARRRGRGSLPVWPASPEDDAAPSLVIGELHHPVVPRESERPSWLVVPETGLYTGVLIVGAVGPGKTTACMYPFAQQLLSWQADRAGTPGQRPCARGQGRLLLQRAGDPRRRRARRRLPRDRARRLVTVEPARRSAARLLLARLRRRLPHQPALRQEPRTVLAASLYESRALDHRTVSALAEELGHAARHLPLHGGCGTVRPEDRRGPRAGRPALPGAGHRRDQGSRRSQGTPRGMGLGAGARHGQGGLPARSLHSGTGSRNSRSHMRRRRAGAARGASSVSRSRPSSGGICMTGRRSTPSSARRSSRASACSSRSSTSRRSPACSARRHRTRTNPYICIVRLRTRTPRPSGPCRASGAGCRRSAS